MSCPPFDLRDYYFKDLAENDRRLTELHVKTCAHCREELDRLRGTETALLALPDEEIPQRIGFVSDPVFQASAFRRGWEALWGSAARLSFASVAMLSLALVVFSLNRPAPQDSFSATARARAMRAVLETEVSKRVNDAVTKAVAESEARQSTQTRELLAASERRHALETQSMMVRVQEYLDVEKKRMNRLILASNDTTSVDGDAR
jgi:acyl-CoA synthetase (AMP-forming)/AMP-acid ligase II